MVNRSFISSSFLSVLDSSSKPVMNRLTLAVALCCLSVAQSTYHSGHKIMLQSVPDLSSYQKISYPTPTIHELGESSEGGHEPEVIKITKHISVKVPVPYPVKVPHKVPYPVPYKVPHIVKVPHVVKIAHAVPVEVVKHVPVHTQQEEGHGQGAENYGIQQISYGGGGGSAHGYEAGASEGGAYGGGYDSNGGGQQSDWQGIQSGGSYGVQAAYGAPSTSYGVPHQSYSAPQSFSEGGSDHGSEESNSVGDYQQQYSTLGQGGGYEQGGEGGDNHEGQGGDYSAQASSAMGQNQNGAYVNAQAYQGADTQQSAGAH